MSAALSPSKHYGLAPAMDRPSSAGDIGKLKKGKKGSPQILSKIGDYIKHRKRKDKEEGEVRVKPRCFVDPPSDRQHSESPEPGANGRSASTGPKLAFKVNRKKEERPAGPMWRVKGRLEWESDSGRQLTITDIQLNDLSKVEIESLQRQAVNSLQALDIPVSHGLLKGARGKLQMRSFNTFNRKKVNGSEKQDRLAVGGESGIFGQPLASVLSKDPNRSTSGTSTPVTPNSTLPRTLHPPSLSPTSTSSSETCFFEETNATAMLLEALSSQNRNPSPRSRRRQSLCPADRQVPSIVTKAIDYLDTKGVKMEGLFRISGAKSRINEIREMFDSGQDVELTDDMNPHDVACLLKEFFRSLPEPLLTRDLYQPFLATRKLSNSAQRRDALRLLCILLPHANRDTLQELLQFLSRVALHSNGIILIDGTEETGNLMTEKNLALIIGPNILHKESKRNKGDNLLQKSEQEELQCVCQVMEDLIRMQNSIFTIPAQLYDTSLRLLATTDPDALDQILKRRCYDQGLYLASESPDSTMGPRSRSTEGLRKVSINSNSSALTLDSTDFRWRRSRSLSDTQKCLDDAIKSLEAEIAEDLTLYQSTLDGDSTDSAVGEMSSPLQSGSEPSTLNRKRDTFRSRDSAFSNNSSPTNSSEGMNNSDILSLESDSPFTMFSHTRMSSGISGLSAVSTESPTTGRDSPLQASSPQLGRKGTLCGIDTASMPSLNGKVHHPLTSTISSEDGARKTNTLPSPHTVKKNKVQKLWNFAPVSGTGMYSIQRSPILSSKECKFHSETQLHILSCDHTPTDSSTEIATSPSRYSLDCENFHTHTEGTVI